MSALNELLQQRDQLNAKIEQIKATEKAEAVSKVREMMDQYGLTLADISKESGGKKIKIKTEETSRKVEPKYRDSVTGQTWSGRGIAPKWIAGKDRESFLIK